MEDNTITAQAEPAVDHLEASWQRIRVVLPAEIRVIAKLIFCSFAPDDQHKAFHLIAESRTEEPSERLSALNEKGH